MTQTKITSFRGQHAFLSNFHACRIKYIGLEFSSVESAFQAAKCANPADRVAFQYYTAGDAKRQGRTVALRPDWEEKKADILLELLFTKFGTNAALLRQLLATGDALLVEENCWHDNYWGNCTCSRRECVQTTGKNMLGQLLMTCGLPIGTIWAKKCTNQLEGRKTMPYRFVENEIAVNYMGIPIYHVYRNNFEDGGWREYWFTKEPFGCEDDDDAFDIRDQAEYDPRISPAANLVKMIRDGHFGPPPDDYDRYVDEENSKAGVCPVCESRQLEYGILEVLDASVAYPFTCENCGACGNEYASLAFNGFSVD